MSLPREELEKGQAQLKRLVSNHFFRSEQTRDLPTFDASEICVGPRLGVGGFGVVCEVQQIKLDDNRIESNVEHAGQDGAGGADDENRRPPSLGTRQSTVSAETSEEDTQHKVQSARHNDADAFVFESDLQCLTEFNVGQHDHHYNMSPSAARAFMAEHTLRDGDARYAIKKIKPDLSDEDKVYAVKDLAIEAKFLAVVSHPNIIKMRGMAATDSLRYDFFILLDRLYETLDQKIGDWAEQEKQFAGFCGGICGANKDELKILQLERITALYDVSKALAYLHENNIIYRDLKPENLGFDVRGDMKLFDFGLSRVLQKKAKQEDGTYKMTGRTGSLRYMAPEVALSKPYNLTADVFSFATLMWQVLELKTPYEYESFSAKDYITQVCVLEYRPHIPSKWPAYLRALIKDSWKADLAKRPDFTRVTNVLRGEMRDMADAGRASIHQRSAHMMDRSNRSQRNLMRTVPAETENSIPGISLRSRSRNSSDEEGGGGESDRHEED